MNYAPLERAADAFSSRLRAELLGAMRRGGPVAAVDVCATRAQAIRADLAREHGVRIGRASLRLRTDADAAPEWVAAWLRAQGERPAAGVRGLRTAAGGRARLLRPIAVDGPCVACHGAPEAQPEALRAALAARYPADRATGYAVGDLRGALWVEATQ
ncbi:MAG: DUF3365 domain-containing protein [Polyangiales bacterium]